ncbi:MAG: VCBS repeat-containing protein [Acidimicrobiales bacterium]|nr:VCBS repeat-containing protein [Acidimicrobiales bacterium]
MRTRRVFRWTLALCAACTFGTLGSPVGSSLTVAREVIDDRHAGDCTELGDLDGDQRLDVVNGGGLADQAVALRAYGGAGLSGRLLAEAPAGAAFVGACALGDIDADNDLDLIVLQAPVLPTGLAGTPAHVVWLENTGATGQPWTAHPLGAHPAGVALDVAVGDLDGDGTIDIASRSDASLAVWRNTGTWQPETIAVPAGRGLTSADLDGDGRGELLAGGFLVMAAPGGGWAVEAINGEASATAASADFDADGRIDVALGPFDGSGPIAIHRRGPDGWLSSTVTTDTAGLVHHLEAADLDGDTDLDLVSAVLHGAVTLHLNLGQGRSWTAAVIDPDGLFDFAVGDLDGDRDADIVGSNAAGNAPLVLFSNRAADPVPLGGEPTKVAVTGGPTPLPSTTTAPPPAEGTGAAAPTDGSDTGEATAVGGSDDGGATAVGGSDTAAVGAAGGDGAAPAVSDEVALGVPTMATAAPRTAPGDGTGTAVGTERVSGEPVALGPPSVDPEVAVLPQTLERAAVERDERTVLAVLLAAAAAGTGWLLLTGRAPLPSVTGLGARRRGGPAELSDAARAAGAPAAPTDPATPTDADPAS